MSRFYPHCQILIAVPDGTLAGWLFGQHKLRIQFVGTLFLWALKMIIVPLILTSIVIGVAGIVNTGSMGRMGLNDLIYYLGSSCLWSSPLSWPHSVWPKFR